MWKVQGSCASFPSPAWVSSWWGWSEPSPRDRDKRFIHSTPLLVVSGSGLCLAGIVAGDVRFGGAHARLMGGLLVGGLVAGCQTETVSGPPDRVGAPGLSCNERPVVMAPGRFHQSKQSHFGNSCVPFFTLRKKSVMRLLDLWQKSFPSFIRGGSPQSLVGLLALGFGYAVWR